MQCVMATILVLWSWLAACIVHTLWTCAHRREDKRAMGIPFSVQLPSERAEQFLNRCNQGVHHLVRLTPRNIH